MVVLFKMFAKSHMKKKYPIEGFTVEWKRNDSNEIHFDIARCLYRNMCAKILLSRTMYRFFVRVI